MTQFIKDRSRVFTAAIMNNDWKPVKAYCKKYGVRIPDDEQIMKAGIYKAVQLCTDIPEAVKEVAFKKCLELGFSPFINYAEEGETYEDQA